MPGYPTYGSNPDATSTSGSQAASNNSGGGWWGNNWGNVASGALAAWDAYNQYNSAKDLRGAQEAAAQPQETNTASGWDLGPLQGMFGYFANEIPNVYNWTAQQYANMPSGGGARGPGSQTSGLAGDMANYARAEDPMVNAGKDYLSNTVSGQSMNPYLDQMFSLITGGPLAQMAGGGGFSGGGAGAQAAQIGPSSHQNYLTDWYQGILDDPLNNELAQRIMDMKSHGQIDLYNDAVRNANLNAEVNGAYGSSGRVNQQGINAGNLGRGLQEAQTMTAMELLDRGLGASGQVTSLQGNLDSQNAATNRSNAQLASANQQQQNALQLQAAMGMMGYGNDLASLFSQDQRSAAGMIPGYHDIQISDLERAFGANMQLDRARNQASQARAAHQMQMAQMPWQNLGQASNMLQSFAPWMGQQWTQSISPGSYPTGGFANPWGAAMGGGMETYGNMAQLFGGGGGNA